MPMWMILLTSYLRKINYCQTYIKHFYISHVCILLMQDTVIKMLATCTDNILLKMLPRKLIILMVNQDCH
ncbi:hypothetical protein M5K25_027493 [Dendrobium thyrsiflorum]|uniref:Uncharacterized protein n=1 Tax=Dendrobium thyrsiflorum TaxID=117978 RepID=A0ABD0TU00_DENTH